MRLRVLTLLLLGFLGFALGTQIDERFSTTTDPNSIKALERLCDEQAEQFQLARDQRDWKSVQEYADRLVESREKILQLSLRSEPQKRWSNRYRQAARAHEWAGNIKACEHYFREAVESAQDPEEADWAREGLAWAYINRRDWSSLHSLIDEALAESPDTKSRLRWSDKRIKALLKQDRLAEAERALVQMSSQIPNIPSEEQRLEAWSQYYGLAQGLAFEKGHKIRTNEARVAYCRAKLKEAEAKLPSSKR